MYHRFKKKNLLKCLMYICSENESIANPELPTFPFFAGDFHFLAQSSIFTFKYEFLPFFHSYFKICRNVLLKERELFFSISIDGATALLGSLAYLKFDLMGWVQNIERRICCSLWASAVQFTDTRELCVVCILILCMLSWHFLVLTSINVIFFFTISDEIEKKRCLQAFKVDYSIEYPLITPSNKSINYVFYVDCAVNISIGHSGNNATEQHQKKILIIWK